MILNTNRNPATILIPNDYEKKSEAKKKLHYSRDNELNSFIDKIRSSVKRVLKNKRQIMYYQKTHPDETGIRSIYAT